MTITIFIGLQVQFISRYYSNKISCVHNYERMCHKTEILWCEQTWYTEVHSECYDNHLSVSISYSHLGNQWPHSNASSYSGPDVVSAAEWSISYSHIGNQWPHSDASSYSGPDIVSTAEWSIATADAKLPLIQLKSAQAESLHKFCVEDYPINAQQG